MDYNKETILKAIAKELANSSELVNLNRGEEHKIDFIFQGEIVVKKGEDFQQIVSFSLPYDKIIAVLLSKLNNVTIESVVKEALESDLDSSEIKSQASVALNKIKGKGQRSMSGKVTVPSCNMTLNEVDICKYC
jgi:hypothetical protein